MNSDLPSALFGSILDGMELLINTHHVIALGAYMNAGHPYPAIPDGCNTVWHHFDLPDGRPALVVNQKGFTPEQQDNEEEINGCTLVTVPYPCMDYHAAREAMDYWARRMLPPKEPA